MEDPKTDTKQKIKAISLAQQPHNRLFEFRKIGYGISLLTDYAKEIVQREQAIEKREKALQAFVQADTSTRNRILKGIKTRQQTKKLSETTPKER